MSIWDTNAGNVDLLGGNVDVVSGVSYGNNTKGFNFGFQGINDLVGGALNTWLTIEQIKGQKALATAQAQQNHMLNTTQRNNNPGAVPAEAPQAMPGMSSNSGGLWAGLLIGGAALVLLDVI